MGTRAGRRRWLVVAAVLAALVATVSTALVATSTGANENGSRSNQVVVVGDSLVVGSEQQLTDSLAAEGLQTRYLAASGTGLLTDQGVHASELDRMLDESPADLVVIESCCNYDGAYRGGDGHVVEADTPAFWAVWADQVQRMVDVATGHGAQVAVVITPRAIEGTWFGGLEARIQHLNDIYRDLGVPIVDWDAALYPDGTTAGRSTLRMPDGLHLSPAGAEVVASATGSAAAGLLG